jgi:type IV pilus assembly protein PilV|tara:strand:- start:1616 stop:2206 length:591 start_codon:yes stop_codon:yes gene_type:complete
MSIRKSQSGFSMLEVLITLGISIIGLVGLASLQLQTTRAVNDTANRSHAIWVAEDLANRIRANRINMGNYDTGGEPIDCENFFPQKVCSSYHNGEDVVNAAADCSGTEVAAFDLWELACGTSPEILNSITRTSGADYLPNSELEVSVVNSRVDITVRWDVRTSGRGVNENGDEVTIYANTNNVTDGQSTLNMVYNL